MDEHNLKNIELLLTQSLNGIHLLFDHNEVAAVLRTPTEALDIFSFQNISKVQELFHALIEHPSFADKQKYLQDLDPESYEILLRTYFHILDNTAQLASNYVH